MSGHRVQWYEIPRTPRPCVYGAARNCVYCENGICEDPQISKGNGDAKCHRLSNKEVVKMLKETP
jgi:hypothetical protein